MLSQQERQMQGHGILQQAINDIAPTMPEGPPKSPVETREWLDSEDRSETIHDLIIGANEVLAPPSDNPLDNLQSMLSSMSSMFGSGVVGLPGGDDNDDVQPEGELPAFADVRKRMNLD